MHKATVKELPIAEDDESAYGSEEVQSTGLSWPFRRLLHTAKLDSYCFCRTYSCDRNLSNHRLTLEFMWVLHVVFVGSKTRC